MEENVKLTEPKTLHYASETFGQSHDRTSACAFVCTTGIPV